MSARLIVFAALSCFLPILSAQTANSASPPQPAKPDLTGQAVIVEKEATVVRFSKDGSSVRTLSVTEHVLSDAGVRSAGIVSIPFAALTETATFDSVRVHKPSGEVIETPPADAQEVPLPVTQAAPMYSDLRTKQLPVKSLSVGDTLEYRLTLKDTNASAGALWYAMDFTSGIPVKEEVLEVRAPREMSLLIKSKKVQPVVTDEGDERV